MPIETYTLLAMKTIDPIVHLELHVIQKIIDDEIWLEGERRGHAVDPHDPVVMAIVCGIIMSIGEELRAKMLAAYEDGLRSKHENNAMAA